jgi:hypothetical protein
MSRQDHDMPVVLNLTTQRERSEADRELVQKELDRLIVQDVPLLPDHPEVRIAPPIREQATPPLSNEDEHLLGGLKNYTFERLSGLRLVLLLDKWPAQMSEGVISESLGVYIPNLREILGDLQSVLTESGLYEEIKAACNRVSGQDNPVPTVVLLMEAIVESSSDEKWSKLTALAGHSWLTTKVLHHELGHHVFPIKPADYKNSLMVAEGGANWFAWMVGSRGQQEVLKMFSASQSSPYRAYNDLYEWGVMAQHAPGVVGATDALMNQLDRNDIFQVKQDEGRFYSVHWSVEDFQKLVNSWPKWLPNPPTDRLAQVSGSRAKDLMLEIARRGKGPDSTSE